MTKNLIKTFWTGLAVGISISVIFIVMQIFTTGRLHPDGTFFISLSYCLLFGLVLTVINEWFFDYVYHMMVWRKYSKYKLVCGALGSLLLTMLGIVVVRGVMEILVKGEDWASFIATESPSYYGVALVFTIVASVVFHTIYFYRTWQENRVKEQKIIEYP